MSLSRMRFGDLRAIFWTQMAMKLDLKQYFPTQDSTHWRDARQLFLVGHTFTAKIEKLKSPKTKNFFRSHNTLMNCVAMDSLGTSVGPFSNGIFTSKKSKWNYVFGMHVVHWEKAWHIGRSRRTWPPTIVYFPMSATHTMSAARWDHVRCTG